MAKTSSTFKSASKTRHGMDAHEQTLIPHLVVNDAAAALSFYQRAFGATEVMRVPADDGKRLKHAEIRLNGARLLLRDDFPEQRKANGRNKMPPKMLHGTTATMHLEVADCDEAVRRAVSCGAEISMAPMDASWGSRYAKITDPFGHAWSFGHPLRGSRSMSS